MYLVVIFYKIATIKEIKKMLCEVLFFIIIFINCGNQKRDNVLFVFTSFTVLLELADE